MKGLSASGIDKLEAIMLANGKYFYDQNAVFASYKDCDDNSCGTELCAAGFCRLLTIGEEALAAEVQSYAGDLKSHWDQNLVDKYIRDGNALLGITETVHKYSDYSAPFLELPQVFGYARAEWPSDMAIEYRKITDPKERILYYTNALRTRATYEGKFLSLEEYETNGPVDMQP